MEALMSSRYAAPHNRIPPNVLELIISKQERTWQGVIRHVCRDSRHAVRRFEEVTGQKCRIRVKDLSASEDIFRWAAGQVGADKSPLWCREVAASGRLNLLKEIKLRGFPWDWKTCAKAAQHGHLQILQYAREQGCPFEDPVFGVNDMCSIAADGGHIEVIAWLRGQGCTWDKFTFFTAIRGGHLNLLRWLREQGCPCDKEQGLAYVTHCRNAPNSTQIISWLEAFEEQ